MLQVARLCDDPAGLMSEGNVLRVSVIIPTLNEEQSVCAAIESAYAAGADEVIVVDGGSTDRTVEVAESMVEAVVQGRSGRAFQQNLGAEQATGDVFLFLHADCRLSADSIAAVRNVLACFKINAIAGCFRQEIDEAGLKYRIVAFGNGVRVRWLKWAYGDQGIFVRSDVFRSVGGFPEVKFLEDLLLMKRLKRIGKIRLLNAKIVVSARRWQGRGLIRQTLRNWAIVLAAHAGVSPDRLAKSYPNDR